jgi:hypothetical protein
VIQLCYKAWLETRTRFIVGLVALCGLSFVVVLSHPLSIERMANWVRLHPTVHPPWWLDRELHDYVFYIWHRQYGGWFQNAWIVSAVLLGVGGLTQECVRGSVAFSLSLPMKRRQFVVAYALVASIELLILALSPALVVPFLSPFVGSSYSLSEALSRGIILFVGGLIVFGFTSMVATAVESQSVPVIVGIASVIALGVIVSPFSYANNEPAVVHAIDLFRLISGPPDLQWDSVPWVGLVVSAALFGCLLSGISKVSEARDYR